MRKGLPALMMIAAAALCGGADSCEERAPVGVTDDDGGTLPDAGAPMADAGPPEADSSVPTPDSGVPGTDSGTPGTDGGTPVRPDYIGISLGSGFQSDERRTAVTVNALRGYTPPAPGTTPPVIDSFGPCDVRRYYPEESPMTEPPTRVDLGPTAVTVQIGDGPERAVPFDGSSHSLSVPAVPPGTPVQVHVRAAGLPPIDRDLVTTEVDIHRPDVYDAYPDIPAVTYWEAVYDEGADLLVTWDPASGGDGDVKLVLYASTDAIDGDISEILCDASYLTGGFRIPWDKLSSYSVGPGLYDPGLILYNELVRESDDVDGVTVDTVVSSAQQIQRLVSSTPRP